MRDRPAEADPARDKKRFEAVLLSLCGLSLNAIAFLRAVVPSTLLNQVRRLMREIGIEAIWEPIAEWRFSRS